MWHNKHVHCSLPPILSTITTTTTTMAALHISSSSPPLQSHFSPFYRAATPSSISWLPIFRTRKSSSSSFSFQARNNQTEDFYVDDDIGDGFSFGGGKYSNQTSPADEWFKQGKTVKAYSVSGTGEKAKDPVFGLAMGASSQASSDLFRWFYVESGSVDKPPVILIHGFPSQAYSYRKLLPVLSKNNRVIAFDWLGFGFSDKPLVKNGFDYTLGEYVSALETFIDEVVVEKFSLVAQGYFAPVVVKYASTRQEKINDLILLNPPITDKHAKLPSSLTVFSNFLLGEIFSQDPLRASDKTLTSCGPYLMKEEDAMVYRSPYLTSGSSGFALTALSRTMKKELQTYVEEMRKTLMDDKWKVRTTVCWGQRDRWLSYDGVKDFCNASKHKLIELPMAGHHVQEDSGEEVGQIIAEMVRKKSLWGA